MNGNFVSTFTEMQKRGYNIMAMWHVTCNNIAFTTGDPANPEYWKVAWEIYRWVRPLFLHSTYMTRMGRCIPNVSVNLILCSFIWVVIGWRHMV